MKGKRYLVVLIKLVVCASVVVLDSLWCQAQPAAGTTLQKTKARPTASPSVGVRPASETGGAQPTTTPPGAGAGAGAGAGPGNSAAPTLSSSATPKDAQLPARKTVNDAFVDRSGGKVYSTGAEDIRLRILPNEPAGRSRPTERWVKGYTPFQSAIYLVSHGAERFIGYNIPGGGTMNLGKIPVGELIFAIKTFDGFTFQTGDAVRNPDKLDHAFTRTFLSDVIEVWFEDAAGPIHTARSDRDFDDICIQLSGGVTGNGAISDLVKIIKEQKGETREEAIMALKKIDPKAAAEAAGK